MNHGDLSNLSLSQDQLVINDDQHSLSPLGDEEEKFFDQPTDMITQISIDRKEKFSGDHEILLRKAIDELALLKQETKLPCEDEQSKFCSRIQSIFQHLLDVQESFSLLSHEFDKVTAHQLKSLDLNRKESMIPGFMQRGEGIKDQTMNTTIYHEAKSRIDENLKNQLSEITIVIKELENKQETIDQKPDPLEKKKIKNQLEKQVKQLQDQSQILELSSYIDNLNSRNLTREDQGKLAYIEEKLNESKDLGKTEIYTIDIYPDENIDLSKNMSKILPDQSARFDPDEEELPAMRVNQIDSNESILSALNDIKSVKLDNYEVSISDMMEINSILQSNFYKSLDNFTTFQTNCLKKALNEDLTEAEAKKNIDIIEKLKTKKLADSSEEFANIRGDENSLLFIINLLGQIFEKEMKIQVILQGKHDASDLDKLSYLSTGDNRLYQLNLFDQNFDDIIANPIDFEKFNAEVKFYIAASLKLDPNLIRVVRIKKAEKGSLVDVDIRAEKFTLEIFEKEKPAIEKRFGAITISVFNCMKKLNIALEDFDFRHNMHYGGYREILSRGGYPYYIPGNSWKRVGLNVMPKYRKVPPYNDKWLTDNSAKGWAVAYHGLRYEGMEAAFFGITEGGFSRGWSNYHDEKEFQLDVSPNSSRIENDCIENAQQVRVFVAEQLIDNVDKTYEEIGVGTTTDKPWVCTKIGHYNYLRPHKLDFGSTVYYTLIAFQCRINPAAIRVPNLQRDYLIINGPENVRAYGIMLKEVTKEYYDRWNKKYDFMGRFYQTDKIIYNRYYEILEGFFKTKMFEDFSILGHKKEWIDAKAMYRFSHIYNRGGRPYYRPSPLWIRIGLNVEKLYPHIDWRSRLTRGTKADTEWPVGYIAYDIKDPFYYKHLPAEVTVYSAFAYAEKFAEIFTLEENQYKILIQVRYNHKNTPAEETTYKIAGTEILPYGILIKLNTRTKLSSIKPSPMALIKEEQEKSEISNQSNISTESTGSKSGKADYIAKIKDENKKRSMQTDQKSIYSTPSQIEKGIKSKEDEEEAYEKKEKGIAEVSNKKVNQTGNQDQNERNKKEEKKEEETVLSVPTLDSNKTKTQAENQNSNPVQEEIKSSDQQMNTVAQPSNTLDPEKITGLKSSLRTDPRKTEKTVQIVVVKSEKQLDLPVISSDENLKPIQTSIKKDTNEVSPKIQPNQNETKKDLESKSIETDKLQNEDQEKNKELKQ